MEIIQKKIITFKGYSYNSDVNFEKAMKEFRKKKVISVALLESERDEYAEITEKYIVFYQDIEDDSDNNYIDAGDLVYHKDVNTKQKIYETVEKVIYEDGMTKCLFVETDESEGGFVEIKDVVLVAKRKDRKDIE